MTDFKLATNHVVYCKGFGVNHKALKIGKKKRKALHFVWILINCVSGKSAKVDYQRNTPTVPREPNPPGWPLSTALSRRPTASTDRHTLSK